MMGCVTEIYVLDKAAARRRGASIPAGCAGMGKKVYIVICRKHFDFTASRASMRQAKKVAKDHRQGKTT